MIDQIMSVYSESENVKMNVRYMGMRGWVEKYSGYT